ncbi:MAG: hypothetical protein JWP64_3261 [Pseudonocardia sp.]|nr:hypothetical protein [Pseudonocardia sp.]
MARQRWSSQVREGHHGRGGPAPRPPARCRTGLRIGEDRYPAGEWAAREREALGALRVLAGVPRAVRRRPDRRPRARRPRVARLHRRRHRRPTHSKRARLDRDHCARLRGRDARARGGAAAPLPGAGGLAGGGGSGRRVRVRAGPPYPCPHPRMPLRAGRAGADDVRRRGTSPSDSALVPASVRRWLGSRARSSWSGCSPGPGRSNSCPRRAGRRSSVRASSSVVCARYRCGSASGEHGRAGTRAPHERFSSVSAGLRSVTRRTPRMTTPTTNQPKPRVWAATWALTTT